MIPRRAFLAAASLGAAAPAASEVIDCHAHLHLLSNPNWEQLLFRQASLPKWLQGAGGGSLVDVGVFGTGAGLGWTVWFLRCVKTYGSFFHLLLLIITVGVSWYARLMDLGPVQIGVMGFLLGSLFRLAKDLLDRAGR